MFFHMHSYVASKYRIMNDELKITRKEAAMAHLETPYQHCLEGMKRAMKSCQDGPPPRRDLKWGPPYFLC
jgi:hypothetical protein